jgi:DNA-binding IclR family transcriptional regulator
MKKNESGETAAGKTNRDNPVQSVQRAADILNCIGEGCNSLSEIALKCRLSKSTTHRLLKALAQSELVMQNPLSRRYFLGYLFVKLTLTPSTSHEFLVDCAGEEMQRLSDASGETVTLRIKLGLKNIGLHLVQSKNDLIVVEKSLRIRPISMSIDGRVLLSLLGDEELAQVLESIRLEPVFPGENTGSEDMAAKIALIRKEGFGVSSNDLIPGVTCIAAPLKNYILPAVLIIAGPEIRIKPRLKALTLELIDSTRRISERLGSRG